ncbi:olfactory receptor 5V1-like [Protobothrops mucrosquamatus]|uniref:olfactory receptor 5V1-like n=1 Tax=Protobothrops mucrosquamatus TaxID=103944 RepID=UPI000775DA13|nr:olfactory receptor 5V1-like [Protobothrops mucrosquamatus]
MNISNKTAPSEFILLAFSDLFEWNFFLSGFMIFTYFFTVMGNALIVFLVFSESNLQTPMYFFLINLSVLDICLNTTTIPQLIVNLLSGKSVIAYERCKIQLFFYVLFVGNEFLLLGVMAYDRYVAICNPLRYIMVMSQKLCSQLLSAIWLISSLNSTIHTVFTFSLPLCRGNKINYFYCDISPFLAISCGNISRSTNAILATSPIMGLAPAMCIIISYICIISRILKMNSSAAMRKAISTCASHFIVVLLYCGSCLFSYIRPTSSYSLNRDSIVALVNNMISPILNPLIYTLRNKDVKEALQNIMRKKLFSCKTECFGSY